MRFLILAFLSTVSFGSSALTSPPSARIEPYVGFKTSALSGDSQSAGLGVNFDQPIAGGLTGFRLGGNFSPTLALGIEFAYGYLPQDLGQLMTRDAGVFC